ncbi:type II TA system antitoxin MqsA family protein [Hathewaya limosa]|uniref:Zinc finger/helix-turn-helix YgiT family protein n=1 Tax=Hathewaya limosa TaxID=1536 RepID=A0ABU0JU36_HATLI|nr:type II TA system antitoxin MqsA family protein [Hathewaya limosa]MDQ0480616.1 putative zinc finger/helix-turn-helix YgiT family protein [Hathewaya limosa]
MILKENEIYYDCPFCDEEHVIQIKTEKSKVIIKDKQIEYEKTIYYCPIEDESFVSSKLMDENLLKARDQYKRSEGLLTSEEIKKIRELYELTQKEFSNLLGWGDVTVQRYEKKLIQDSTYDDMLRLTLVDPAYCLSMLEKHKDKFSNDRFIQIKNKIKQVIKSKGNLYLKTKEIKNCYIDFDEQSDLNGYKMLDLKKVNSVMGYFANYIKPLYKVKLMKLLWYTDALFYKKHGRAMTGLVYQHLPLGAVPIAYNEILTLPSIKVVEEFFEDYVAYKICSKEQIAISDFTLEELSVLEKVTLFFKDFKTKEIVEYMHDEVAYVKTNADDIIPYSLSKQIKEFKEN